LNIVAFGVDSGSAPPFSAVTSIAHDLTDGTLDPPAWEELALRYESFNRQERNTMLRRSLLSLQTKYDENLKP
jgi:hypothetical protein